MAASAWTLARKCDPRATACPTGGTHAVNTVTQRVSEIQSLQRIPGADEVGNWIQIARPAGTFLLIICIMWTSVRRVRSLRTIGAGG